jgi:FkbH-like protein
MIEALNYPLNTAFILRKKKSIRRELLNRSDFLEKRIAILGGSTTTEIRDILELFLLRDGIKPVFYQSEYNKYAEDILFGNKVLEEFAPDLFYIHTTNVNIERYPRVDESPEELAVLIENEYYRFQHLWDQIFTQYSCPVIQNNFELPHYRVMGNLDCYDTHGRVRFVNELNQRFSMYAQQNRSLYINDINYISAWFGLERWYDKLFWYSYKYAMSYEAIPILSNSIASIITAIYGKTKKCLVLDLDNTLWGGIIGDDGVNGICIGKETPEAEAFSEFQSYIKMLKDRGIILAINSKNDRENALEGFSHPDSILKPEDFSACKANWEPKHENIRGIARTLDIGADSMVFVDDNPVERDIVRAQEPAVAVPELGNCVERYITVLDKTGYFESVSLSPDDLKRTVFYSDNTARHELSGRFDNYDDFLKSLDMVAEIKPFAPMYLERIAQLTNKTNQFNVTTKRYSYAEIETIAGNSEYISLYGRLRDKFGDNGLISVLIGVVKGAELHIDLWLMSCRVLRRGMELAMFDQLVDKAQQLGITRIFGYFSPTKKNEVVRGLFNDLEFNQLVLHEGGDSTWYFDIPERYLPKNKCIEVT